jgi:hypothetical protein
METEIKETTEQASNALDSVRQRVKDAVSQNNSRQAAEDVDASDETTLSDETTRGTSDTGEESKGSAETAQDSTEETTAASNGGDVNKDVSKPKESRENARIRELNEKTKAAEARAKELEDKLAKATTSQNPASSTEQAPSQVAQPPKAQEVPQLVPPPVKPQYEKAQLLPLLKKYQDAGDVEMAWAVQLELENIRDYEIKHATWENQNARAWENHQSTTNYWKSEVGKKWPDLSKADSTISKARTKVEAFIKDVQSNPAKFEYNQAYMADIFDRSQRFDAAETEIKQLREKIASLEKKGQPATINEAPEVDSPSSGKSPITEVRSKMKDAIKRFQSFRPSTA